MKTACAVLFLLIPGLLDAAVTNHVDKNIIKVVTDFCRSELDGAIDVETREKLITINSERIKKWQETESAVSPLLC